MKVTPGTLPEILLLEPRVFGDEVWLGRLADNLVSNAIKYTGKGGHVRISLAEAVKHPRQVDPQGSLVKTARGLGI